MKPPIQIVKTDRSCWERLPEQQTKPRIDWAGPAEGCDERWETCLDGENADSLGEWIEKALAYQAAVKAECGQEKNDESNP